MDSSQEMLAWRTPLLMAGAGLSAFTSGALAALSLITVPALLATRNTNTNTSTSTASLLTSWRHTLEYGFKVCPPFALAATCVHLFNAYAYSNTSSGNSVRSYLLTAAASTIAIVPFTIVAMSGTNDELFRREKAAAAAEAQGGKATGASGGGVDPSSSRELVKKWGRLNAVRSVLPAVGCVVACCAL